jgi:type IV pilus assembly protein PilY1
MNFSFAANPTAVDLNNDGFIDQVYIGDVGGQMWKFDVSATGTTAGTPNWLGKRLFAAPLASGTTNPPAAGEWGDALPAPAIYGAPVLARDKDLKLWVFFGTGDRNHPNNATAPNRFYGIKDTTNMTNGAVLTEDNLADVTSANATAASGWFVRLAPNEKVLAAGNVFNMVALFSTFTPLSTATCESGGGTAKLYAVQVKTGYAAVDFTDGSALVSTDSTKTRSKTIGGGIASMPVIVLTPPATSDQKPLSSAVVGTTNQQLLSNAIPAPAVMKQVRWWRELAQ